MTSRKHMILALTAILAAPSAFTANLFYNGTGDWTDAANWTSSDIADSDDAAIIRNGDFVTIDDTSQTAGDLYIANFDTGGTASLTVSGGSLTVSQRFFIARGGAAANATVTHTGGDIVVNGGNGFRIAHTSVGGTQDAGNTGVYTGSGGTFTINASGNDIIEVGTSAGGASSGTLTVSGTEFTANNADANFGSGGTLNVSDGTFAVRQLEVASGGAFNFTGGSLLLGSAGGTHNIAGGISVPSGGYLGSIDPATIYTPTVTDGGAGTDLAFANNSTFGLNLSGITGTADTWTVDTLDLSGSPTITLELDLILGSVEAGDQFTFLNYTTLNGDFNNVTWQFSAGGGAVELAGASVVNTGSSLYFTGVTGFSVPEPSSVMLIGIGTAILRMRLRTVRRKRRD